MSFKRHSIVLTIIFAALLCAVWVMPAQGQMKGVANPQREVTLHQVVLYADHALVRNGYRNSPLRREMVGIVKAARAEGISPFFILSISGVESTFGEQACGYNAWGWGSCRGFGFRSFSEGARVVATGLRVNYLGKWHKRTIEEVGGTYCVGSSWPNKVRYFMDHVFHAGGGMRWNDALRTVR